jgi:hypothetical protein
VLEMPRIEMPIRTLNPEDCQNLRGCESACKLNTEFNQMGHPKTSGPDDCQVVRMQSDQIAAIDAWISAQSVKISRPEAIRRLVQKGLQAWVDEESR